MYGLCQYPECEADATHLIRWENPVMPDTYACPDHADVATVMGGCEVARLD